MSLESPQRSLLQHSHIIPNRSSYYMNNNNNVTIGIQTRYVHSQQNLITTPSQLLLQTSNYDTQYSLSIRQFATKSSDTDDNDDDNTNTEKKKDLRESIERLKKEKSGNTSDESTTEKEETEPNPHIEKLTQLSTSFFTQISQTWDELISSGQATDINKKIGTPNSTNSNSNDKPNYANDDEAADKYEEYKGSKNIMVIDNAEELSAWERMERRLRDAPIISGMLILYSVFSYV